MRERARAFATRSLPLYDRERNLQEDRQLETASIRGSQFARMMSPKPMKIPRILIMEEDQSMAIGASLRPLQEPSQRPLHLPRLSFEPEAFSKRLYVSKTAFIPESDVTMADWETRA